MEKNRVGEPQPSPPVKVVGFHVEGAEPSPRNKSFLEEARVPKASTGSPSPVMIPPNAFPGKIEESSFNEHAAAIAVLPEVNHTAVAAIPSPVRNSGTSVQHPESPSKEPLPEKNEVALSPEYKPPTSKEENKGPTRKELTKAERRALQTAQRAAKAVAKGSLPPQHTNSQLQKSTSNISLSSGIGPLSSQDPKSKQQADKFDQQHLSRGSTQKSSTMSTRTVDPPTFIAKSTELFAHLQQYRKLHPNELLDKAAASSVSSHVVRLGLHMADGTIRGANARVLAMLELFSAMIADFKVPSGKEFVREFTPVLNNAISVLVTCRPLNVAMGNAIKAVKAAVEQLKVQEVSEGEARKALLDLIKSYSQEKLKFATEVLVRHGVPMIAQQGDVIIVYSYSSTVAAVLLAAKEAGKSFSVVVVDARPILDGRKMLRRLLAVGIPCEYVHLNGLSFALGSATKAILGAGSVLSNGAVLARAGTATVAMATAATHIPVIVCCETHKFHERVQLDSITHNELGDPEEILHSDLGTLGALNLVYDVSPAEYISVVVTEVGAVPPTSVPAVLREYRVIAGAF